MKRISLCCFLPLIFSCGINDWSDTVIINNSDFEVTFQFSDTKQISLVKGEQATFPTKAYQRLEKHTPAKRVHFMYSATNDGYTGEFLSLPSWTIDITNKIGQQVTLSADGWMDEVIINAGVTVTGKVYTEEPNFVVRTQDNFPAVVLYNRDPDGTFKVTIQ